MPPYSTAEGSHPLLPNPGPMALSHRHCEDGPGGRRRGTGSRRRTSRRGEASGSAQTIAHRTCLSGLSPCRALSTLPARFRVDSARQSLVRTRSGQTCTLSSPTSRFVAPRAATPDLGARRAIREVRKRLRIIPVCPDESLPCAIHFPARFRVDSARQSLVRTRSGQTCTLRDPHATPRRASGRCAAARAPPRRAVSGTPRWVAAPTCLAAPFMATRAERLSAKRRSPANTGSCYGEGQRGCVKPSVTPRDSPTAPAACEPEARQPDSNASPDPPAPSPSPRGYGRADTEACSDAP